MIESVVDVFFLYTYVQVQIRVEDTTVVRNKTDKQWNFFFLIFTVTRRFTVSIKLQNAAEVS